MQLFNCPLENTGHWTGIVADRNGQSRRHGYDRCVTTTGTGRSSLHSDAPRYPRLHRPNQIIVILCSPADYK